MADNDRYCANCRALIPPGASVCPACGVYAGDVFDGRLPGRKRRRGAWLAVIAALVVAGAAAWLLQRGRGAPPRLDIGPIRVVGDRPGGARRPAGASINEPEAMLTLRRYLRKSFAIKDECIAAVSTGYSNGYYTFDSVDRCDRTSLGRWRVDAKTRKVSR